MMKRPEQQWSAWFYGAFLAGLGAVIAFNAMFIVPESYRALVVQFGDLVLDTSGQPKVYKPGLHWRWPLISQVLKFDQKLQTLELGGDTRVVTAEQKYLLVTLFAKWRIVDCTAFFKATRGQLYRARQLLAQKLFDGLRREVGLRSIPEVVSGERIDIMALMRDSVNRNAQALGIEIVDVRMKKIELPEQVSDSVFNRMRTEREQVAEAHRAKDARRSEEIRAAADGNCVRIVAKAQREAQEIMGQGDAKATAIYLEAYQKDREFFEFYRKLLALETSVLPQDTWVIRQDELFKSIP